MARQIWRRAPNVYIVAFVAAAIGSVLYFLPLVGALGEGGSHWPAFMMTSDIKEAWFPAFVEGYHRFWSGGLIGMDFLTLGGASDFGVRPNMLPFYPPFLLAYLLFDVGKLGVAAAVFVAIYVAHMFAALYFCVLLGRRYLGLSTGASVLFAALFGLSVPAAIYIAFPPFYFQMMLVPVVAYMLCALLFARSWAAPILASLVIVLYMLTSYGPTMAAGLLVAYSIWLFVYFTRIWPKLPARAALNRLLPGMATGAVALLVVGPYYLAQADSLKDVIASPNSLQWVAQTLSLSGQSLVSALSLNILGAPTSESRLYFGLIPTAIVLIGMALAIYDRRQLSKRTLALLVFTLSIYVGAVLITLGSSSIASDMFYYGVPMLGRMHIYARYLNSMQLFFALAVSTCASLIVRRATVGQRLAIFGAGIAVWIGLSFWLVSAASASKLFVVDPFLVELFLLFVGLTLLAFGRSSIAVAAVALPVALSSLTHVYSLERDLGQAAVWQTNIDYSQATRKRMASLLAVNGKALPKVVNLIDSFGDRYLPFNYAWLLDGRRKYMTFDGYDALLSIGADYKLMLGAWWGVQNREWILRTGVDFALWNEPNAAKLAELVVDTISLGKTTPIGGGVYLTRLNYGEPPRIGQKSVLLSLSESDPDAWRIVEADGWRLEGGRVVKSPGKENRFGLGISPVRGASYAVSMDIVNSTRGTLYVAFGGSTGQPISGSEPGRHTQRFNVHGFGDLQISSTTDFDGAVTNILVEEVGELPPEMVPVFDNGVVRLEAKPGKAELRNFTTNWTTSVSADLSSSEPARVVFLLWPNRFMRPYLDGRPADWVRLPSWPAYIDVPPGNHVFGLKYENRWVQVFTAGSGLYVAIVMITLGTLAYRRCVRNKVAST